MPVYEQSVRNCPWVVDFWLGYARTMERNSADTEDVHGKKKSKMKIDIHCTCNLSDFDGGGAHIGIFPLTCTCTSSLRLISTP